MKRLLLNLNSLLLALALSSSVAYAVPLLDLFNGQTITAGDKLFDRWSGSFITSDPAFDPDVSLIEVTPLTDGGNDPGPGLAFDAGAQLTLTGNDFFSFIDLTFGFRVSTLGSDLIKDNSLNLGQAVVTLAGNNGSIITEDIGTAPGLFDLGTKSVELSFLDGLGLTQVTTDRAEFAPQSEIFVTKNILVFADTDEQAGIFGFQQRFSQIPEPATTALLALGIVGLGISRRGRRRREIM